MENSEALRICCENLHFHDDDRAAYEKSRKYMTGRAARLLCEGISDDPDAVRERFCAYPELAGDDRLFLHLAQYIQWAALARTAGIELTSPPVSPLTALNRSDMSDRAYDIFRHSKNKDMRMVYRDSFSAVCEELYNGGCDYALLPCANADEGTLAGTLRLMDKYDLKIAAKANVPGYGDLPDTVFSLLSREARVELSGNTEINCTVRIPHGAEKVMPGIFSSAAVFGCRVTECNTFPAGYYSGGTACDITVGGRREYLLPFICRLEMTSPEFLIRGIFTVYDTILTSRER